MRRIAHRWAEACNASYARLQRPYSVFGAIVDIRKVWGRGRYQRAEGGRGPGVHLCALGDVTASL